VYIAVISMFFGFNVADTEQILKTKFINTTVAYNNFLELIRYR